MRMLAASVTLSPLLLFTATAAAPLAILFQRDAAAQPNRGLVWPLRSRVPCDTPFSAPLLTLRLHLHRLHLPSLLRNYFVKPLLGAIWKQPLKPHHALDLEPDWVAHLAEEEVVLKEALQEAVEATEAAPQDKRKLESTSPKRVDIKVLR